MTNRERKCCDTAEDLIANVSGVKYRLLIFKDKRDIPYWEGWIVFDV
jgi:hypothetical protein